MKKFSRMPKSDGSGGGSGAGGGGGPGCPGGGGGGSGAGSGASSVGVRVFAVGRYQVTLEEPLAEAIGSSYALSERGIIIQPVIGKSGKKHPPGYWSCFQPSPHIKSFGEGARPPPTANQPTNYSLQGRHSSLAEAAKPPGGETEGSMYQASQTTITLATISAQTLVESAQDPKPQELLE